MRAANLQFCAFLLFLCQQLADLQKGLCEESHRIFGTNDLQICKNDYASRLAEMEKSAFCRLGTKPFVGLLWQVTSQTHVRSLSNTHIQTHLGEYVDLWRQKMDRLLAELQIRSTYKWKSGTLYYGG
jgi:hypothetical protein